MYKKILILAMLGIMTMQNSVWATNWIFVQRLEGTRYGSCSEYLDSDSVIRQEERLLYWTLWVMDSPPKFDDLGKILWKVEGRLLPKTSKIMYQTQESYKYDSTGQEISRHNVTGMFSEAVRDSASWVEIQLALKHTNNSGVIYYAKPTDLKVSTPQ